MVNWFAKGLRFGCTQCGKCCTGSPGYVFLDEEDIERLAQALQIDRDTFLEKYTRRLGTQISLKELEPHYDCILLQKGLSCSVYGARPKQCRTFPFWSDVIESEKEWKEAGKTCEGIDNPEGTLFSEDDILSFFSS